MNTVESISECFFSQCVVLRVELGHLCGYVSVTPDHPLYGKGFADKLECLPFSDIENENIGKRGSIPCFLHGDSEYCSPDVYFDVHGSITYSGPSSDKYPVETEEDLWWFGFDTAHAEDRDAPKSLEYVIEECERLAEQLFDLERKVLARRSGINPCPFCKGLLDEYDVCSVTGDDEETTDEHCRFVACPGCGMNGPFRRTAAEAIRAWNRLEYRIPLLECLPDRKDGE